MVFMQDGVVNLLLADAPIVAGDTWQRVVITVLTVLAFALASWGLGHAFTSTARIARRVEQVQRQRRQITQELHEELQRIAGLDASPSDGARMTAVANARFHAAHKDAGIVPLGYQERDYGAEPVAESLVHDLSAGTRVDLLIAGAGLLLGLIASVWGAWI